VVARGATATEVAADALSSTQAPQPPPFFPSHGFSRRPGDCWIARTKTMILGPRGVRVPSARNNKPHEGHGTCQGLLEMN